MRKIGSSAEQQRVVELADKALASFALSPVERSALREVLGIVFTAGATHVLHELGPTISATEETLSVRRTGTH